MCACAGASPYVCTCPGPGNQAEEKRSVVLLSQYRVRSGAVPQTRVTIILTELLLLLLLQLPLLPLLLLLLLFGILVILS